MTNYNYLDSFIEEFGFLLEDYEDSLPDEIEQLCTSLLNVLLKLQELRRQAKNE